MSGVAGVGVVDGLSGDVVGAVALAVSVLVGAALDRGVGAFFAVPEEVAVFVAVVLFAARGDAADVAAFFAVDFSAVAFFAAPEDADVSFAVDFSAVAFFAPPDDADVVFAVTFFAAVDDVVGEDGDAVRAAEARPPVAFFVVAFLAVVFFVVAFSVAFFVVAFAVAFFAVAFFAVAFFAVAFFAGLFRALRAVDRVAVTFFAVVVAVSPVAWPAPAMSWSVSSAAGCAASLDPRTTLEATPVALPAAVATPLATRPRSSSSCCCSRSIVSIAWLSSAAVRASALETASSTSRRTSFTICLRLESAASRSSSAIRAIFFCAFFCLFLPSTPDSDTRSLATSLALAREVSPRPDASWMYDLTESMFIDALPTP